MKCTKSHIRKYLVMYHHLHERIACDDILTKIFGRIGSIQYDPLNVVGRNPDLVLQSRVRDYTPALLEQMLYTERTLIDGWDKMMSIYATEEWPRFGRLRENRRSDITGALQYRNSLQVLDKIEQVISHLQENGASQGGAIGLGVLNAGKWGHRTESSAALDYLFHTGVVGVARKVNTQKIYDLIERIIPRNIQKKSDPFKSESDYHKWFIMRRIGSTGLLWNKNSVLWQNIGRDLTKLKYRQQLINELAEEGELCRVGVESLSDPFYIRKSDTALLASSENYDFRGNVRFIAPLDNLIWERDMTEALFNFSYRWEVYTPAAKRRYGYYVLPVLYRDAFVARIEPAADKKKKELIIKNFWWEDGVKKTKALKSEVAKELTRFARFLGLDTIKSGDFI